jgi:hypothetical protein
MTLLSGLGKYSASYSGADGSSMFTAWKPPECQVVNAICGVSVGLCAEYDVHGGFQSGLQTCIHTGR